MQQENSPNNLDLFFQFIHAEAYEMQADKVRSFLLDLRNPGENEVIYDQGCLLLLSNGKQVDSLPLKGGSDRIVKFNGKEITEINPYAYIPDAEIEMKGDGSGKRRRGSTGGGFSSNNNNNNNNG